MFNLFIINTLNLKCHKSSREYIHLWDNAYNIEYYNYFLEGSEISYFNRVLSMLDIIS